VVHSSYLILYFCHSFNLRLGPPDFHPQTPNCPEETLTRDYVLSGYRETVEGIEVHFYYLLNKLINFLRGSMYNLDGIALLNCKCIFDPVSAF
jgi:hypothetical protein